MKQKTKIFSNTPTKATGLLVAMCAVSLFTGSAIAASNGCDNENNDRINQDLALCSVHAYNTGATKNPNTSSERQQMNEVVALKTTVMTQQMKKQYDYLEVTIKRFKTQLEKAILTAQMEAAGAGPGAADGGGTGGIGAKSTDRNVHLAGTENCNNKNTKAEVYQCLRQNYNVIYNMSSGGQTISTEVRRQLANDYKVATGNMPSTEKIYLSDYDATSKTSKKRAEHDMCSEFQKISGRANVQTCLEALNADIRNASDALSNANRAAQQRTN